MTNGYCCPICKNVMVSMREPGRYICLNCQQLFHIVNIIEDALQQVRKAEDAALEVMEQWAEKDVADTPIAGGGGS